MIIARADERPALSVVAEQLVTAYRLLMERDDPTLVAAMDAVFDALGGVDILAGGIASSMVRSTLDVPRT